MLFEKESFLKELSDTFDNSLSSTFVKNRQLIQSLDRSDFEYLDDWYSISKDHDNRKISFPPNEHRISKTPLSRPSTNRPSSIGVATIGGSIEDTELHELQKKLNVVGKEQRKKKLAKSIRLRSVDSSKITPEALGPWTLKSGWKNRPDILKVDVNVVEDNIKLYALKKKKLMQTQTHGILGPSRYDFIETQLQKELKSKEEKMRDNKPDDAYYYFYKTDEGKSKKSKELKKSVVDIAVCSHVTRSPGPRYNIRSNFDRDAGLSGRTSLLNDSTAKNILFSNYERFKRDIEAERVPGPNTYNPTVNTVEDIVDKMTKVKLHAYGRYFHNSIYCESHNDGPGPAFAVSNGHKLLSRSFPCNNAGPIRPLMSDH